MSQYNSYARPQRRYSNSRPSHRPSRSSGRGTKAVIDPVKFIKAANPGESASYKASHDFGDFAMHPLLKSNVTARGYKTPSEIQDKTIALGLSGRNVVGIADTGTGKTAAFALPILNKLMRSPAGMALVVAPTRELAQQIEEQCLILSKNSGIQIALLIGGVAMGGQKSALRRGARLIIGTPGRIKDHLQQHTLSLQRCDTIVLDEVDHMLDMGFINDVRYILQSVSPNHQAFFFSATINPTIHSLIEGFCSNPETINVKSSETSSNVHQDVVYFSGKPQKMEKLNDILIRDSSKKTLVFGRTKFGVERLAKELITLGFKAQSLHGGKSQGQRKRALDSFRNDHVQVLVATDVAARGIDVQNITTVINFDTPQTYDDYIHRIGRAGRAGRPGHALTFVER